MITIRSSYDQVVHEIDEAVQEFLADQADADLPEDEVWVDLAAAMLIEANEKVAREVCRCQIGHVPQSLSQVWRMREQEKKTFRAQKAQAVYDRRKQERLDAARAAREAEIQQVRSQRCPTCFTLPSASGACLCS